MQDANGATVSATFAVSASGLTLSISPTASTAYPLHVLFSVGFNSDYQSSTAKTADAARRTAASCSSATSIVISYVTQWKELSTALIQNPTPCAKYFVLVPATQGIVPRDNSAARIAALNNRSKVEKAQASFIPVATFDYYKVPAGTSATGYQTLGRQFAILMEQRGYSYWAIDEAPPNLLAGSGDPSWQAVVSLVLGLSTDGAKGIVANAVQSQKTGVGLPALKTYKHSVKGLLNEPKNSVDFAWELLTDSTIGWAEETYTFCSMVCKNNASLGEMASHANDYMQHFGRLAFAPDGPAKTLGGARALLGGSYLPLTNDWKGGDNFAYGTKDLSLGQMKALASLQIYAARAWEDGGEPYTGARIGLRWTDKTGAFGVANTQALAERIAAALKGAYAPGGGPLGACDPSGAGLTANCIPTGVGGAFTKNWGIFAKWGGRGTSGGGGGTPNPCNVTGDSAGPGGGPANDNVESAIAITGDSGSVTGTLVGATLQPDETNHQAANFDATASVWYCFTPDTTGDYTISTEGSDALGSGAMEWINGPGNYDADGLYVGPLPPFLIIYDGTTDWSTLTTGRSHDLDAEYLTTYSDDSKKGWTEAANNPQRVRFQAGQTYLISVSNGDYGTDGPPGAFVLTWAPTPTPTGSDGDGDGIPDANDNCPLVPNADQANTYHGDVPDMGDACSPQPFDSGAFDGQASGSFVTLTETTMTADPNFRPFSPNAAVFTMFTDVLPGTYQVTFHGTISTDSDAATIVTIGVCDSTGTMGPIRVEAPVPAYPGTGPFDLSWPVHLNTGDQVAFCVTGPDPDVKPDVRGTYSWTGDVTGPGQ